MILASRISGDIDVVDFETIDPIGYVIGNYHIEEYLAEGSYGRVYRGFSVDQPDKIVALKLISKERISRDNPNLEVREIVRRLIRSEASIHRKLDSDYTVRCYDVYENTLFMILVQEFCDGGTLRQEIDRRKYIPEREAVRILKHLMLAFSVCSIFRQAYFYKRKYEQELHRHKIIHRDLKSDNVMRGSEKYKIGDFGFAKVVNNLNSNNSMTRLGTLTTMAPEIIKSQPYGIMVDMWSLGVVFYQMLTGHVPYNEVTMKGMAHQIEFYSLNLQNLSSEAAALITKMLNKDPKQRITWKELPNDPIFKKYAGMVFMEEHKDDCSQELIMQAMKVYDEVAVETPPSNPEVRQMVTDFSKNKSSEVEFQKPAISTKQFGFIKRYSNDIGRDFKLYVEQFNFEAQKSVLLYIELVEPLLHKELHLDLDRKVAEFIYLVCSRSFYIASSMKDAFERNVNIYNWQYYNEFMKSSYKASLMRQFVNQYSIIFGTLKKISDRLYKLENKIGQRISDGLWKVFSEDTYKQKDKFLCGIEGEDYNHEQHVEYTLKEYFSQIRSLVRSKTTSSTVNVAEKAKRYMYFLERYKEIALAKYPEQKNLFMVLVEKQPKARY